MQDDNLFKRIKRIENDIIDFKAFQPVGTDSILTYTTMTNNEWDATYTLAPSYEGATNGHESWQIQFLANNQRAPFGRLRVFAEADGSKVNYASKQSGMGSPTEVALNIFDDLLTAQLPDLGNPSLLRFLLDVDGPIGAVVKLKFVVDATDTGRLILRKVTPNGPVDIAT